MVYKDVLIDWNFWGTFKLDDYMPRCYRLEDMLGPGRALVLYGIRRSGKSYLAYGLAKYMVERAILDERETLIVNFEDPRLTGMRGADLVGLYNEYLALASPRRSPLVILDEVQEVDGWERFVRYLQESRKAKVIVTGSSSKLMGREYATLLTGRHVDIEVYTLTIPERLLFKGYTWKDRLDIHRIQNEFRRASNEAIEDTGFPEAVLSPAHIAARLVGTYLTDILEKDIALRHRLKDTVLLHSLARTLVSSPAKPISSRRIAKSMGEPHTTVSRYIRFMQEARIITLLKRLDESARRVEKSTPKLYLADNGFYIYTSHRLSPSHGQLLENTVFLHLARIYKPNTNLYYYKTRTGREVDFAIKEREKVKMLIQVTLELRPEDNLQWRREVSSLVQAAKELGVRNLVIITLDTEDELVVEGHRIKVTPLWRFAMEYTEKHCLPPGNPGG